ncbi:MAG TPA: NADH-quinone oxidoreductase subunit L [Acidimicrobiales bacterium]|nr:NADH-quinone oxidoreductase subunit L [Acidimicrobiales bacterium]
MLHTAWVIPAFPLAGFVLLILGGRRLGDPLAGWLATLMAGGSFVFTAIVFVGLLGRSPGNRLFVQHLWDWIPVGGFKVSTALQIDPLSVTMCLFVTGVGSLIHMYAIGYMKGDPGYPRFFVYLNLFLFSMLMLVLGDNFLLTFFGWEGVGTCSYLLISFWFERDRAASAGKKAFVVNRVGDWGFMVGIFLVFSHFGSVTYTDVLSKVSLGHVSSATATWICLALFLGACGKSAQLPLFVWLPDAMEGPTPVSALIHAATMVTAGVYLLCRISPLLAKAPDASLVIACVGAATAFVAATIACAQDDIKRVLAYSTISQLGYMFVAAGAGAYTAAVFHMITHAFFKALLFLGAGAVIHGMHDQQDMKRMGALRRWMPITAGTFLVAWLAISGIPPFAGFWSKDDILAGAWVYHGWVGHVLYAVLLATAVLTAYYMSRQVALVFFGREHWREADGEHAAHQAEPHEAPWVMLAPLVALAALAVVGGVLNLPYHPWNFLEKWLDPVVGAASSARHISHAGKAISAVVTTVLCLGGIGLGLRVWERSPAHDALEPVFLRRAWLIDWLYAQIIERPGAALSSFAAWVVDLRIIDGSVNGVATLVRDGGGRLRKLQTGYVRNYALGIAAGTVAILTYMVVRAS